MIRRYFAWLLPKGYRLNADYTFEGQTVVIVNKGIKVLQFISQHWNEIEIND